MNNRGIEGFKKHNHRMVLFILFMIALTTITAIAALCINSDLDLTSVLNILFNRYGPDVDVIDSSIVWNLSLPRIMSALLAGMALGAAGAVMQCVLRNPLGSPYTLGISNAAAFGASIGIVLLGGGIIVGQSSAFVQIDNPYIVTASAFTWSMIATAIIIILVKVTKVSPETMVLAGVALSSIFSAGISLLQYIFNEYALSTIVFWQFGSMGKATWEELSLILVVCIITGLYFMYNRLDYNALDAGDDVAASLGVNVNMTRILTLVLAALVTSIVVSFMGIIAFIGLLGPHIVRRFVGNDHRYLIPGSMLMGAIILLISDCIGQNIADFTIPVGILTSFLGGPLFLYLLIRGYRKRKVNIIEKLRRGGAEE